MSETLAPYACDKCKARKVACTRDYSGCKRCNDEGIECAYSRSGVIRRNRKRKHETNDGTQPYPSPLSSTHGQSEVDNNILQSHLATDIDETQERLRGLDTSQHNSLGALSSLSEACAAVWMDASELDMAGKKYFLFEERTQAWVETFITTLNRGRPLMVPPPSEVLDQLRASRPHQVQQRAWLVMYYSIILSMVSSTDPANYDIKRKLRCNLWLAFNDTRILLEPSVPNIQALVLLACHVEEFTTPSLCWLLTSTACRMLQALGINNRRLDPQVREHRIMMFWHFNILDKGLALIFGRPPTFHPAMAREISLPTLDQLLTFQPHVSSTGAPSVFGAHYIHQMITLSRLMADIWNCLHGDLAGDESSIASVHDSLESWYDHASHLLQAAALVEKPFLDARGVTSIELGIAHFEFQHYYLLLLLARCSKDMKAQYIDSAKGMLNMLDAMVSDSEEPYNGLVWQLVCSPFTAFLALFNNMVSNGKGASVENYDALAAMEKLPGYLQKMGVRNSLAAKLERIAVALVQHARSFVQSQGIDTPLATSLNGSTSEVWPANGNALDWDAFLADVMNGSGAQQPQIDMSYFQPMDAGTWTTDLFDPFVDWIGLDSQL